jgi:branched-chain amino acid aminotransferase
MPCWIRELTPAGLQPVAYSAASLKEAALHEPSDGIYTTTSTFNTDQVFKFEAHLDRMEHSARFQNIPARLDRPRIRAALRDLIHEADVGSVRLRLTVPRAQPDHVIISIEPFEGYTPELYTAGVRCMTMPGRARSNPAAKTTDWMTQREPLREQLPPHIYEALLVDENGAVLEGFTSNFYAVLDGELRTAASGMLPGIAQQVVLTVAPSVLPVQQQAVRVAEIPRLSEAFITSSTRGIVPVVEIDGVGIGAGTPGNITQQLSAAYQAWVEANLEDL